MAMTARTISMFSGSLFMREMKERSTLRVSTGSCWSCEREE